MRLSEFNVRIFSFSFTFQLLKEKYNFSSSGNILKNNGQVVQCTKFATVVSKAGERAVRVAHIVFNKKADKGLMVYSYFILLLLLLF